MDIEPFGGNTFAVKSVPVLLSGSDIRSLIVEMVEKAADIGVTQNLDDAMDKCLMVMACHDTVRGNQVLSMAEMRGARVALVLVNEDADLDIAGEDVAEPVYGAPARWSFC